MSRTDEAADSETSVTNGCKVIENHQNYLLSGGVFYVFYCILGKIIYCCPVNNYSPLYCFVVQCFIAIFTKGACLYTMRAESPIIT